MIICKLDGGFGNHLYTFFLACILSNKLKQKIFIEDNIILNDLLSQRKDTRETIYKIINYDYITNKLPESYTKITVNSIEKYKDILALDNVDNLNNSHIVIDSIFNISFSFYNNYYDILQNYIKITKSLIFKDSIVISLRLGMGKNEIAQPSPFEKDLRLPFEYYKKAIQMFRNKNNNINTLFICSDNFDDNYIDNFKIYSDLNVVLCVNKNTLEQFEYIINADCYISSNSSFALFGSFLNRTGITTIPNFEESNAVYPNKINSRYSDTLNNNLENCVKIII